MQYEKYEARVAKIANVMKFIFRHMKKIILCLSLIVVVTGTLLGTKGIIVSAESCPAELTYGDGLDYSANAFLSSVKYEYRAKDSEEWTSEMPVLPGEYYVRAVAEALFGYRYGDEELFVLKPRPITVSVSGSGYTYGEKPTLVADTAFSDTLVCDSFDYSADMTKITAIKSAIKVTSADGKDVTSSYEITAAEGNVKINPRPISISIPDKSKTYDSTALSSSEYTISSGTLAGDDVLNMSFDDEIINVGFIQNKPVLSITNADGEDVTGFYAISLDAGKLTVTARPITVTTNNDTKVYDGTELMNSNVSVIGILSDHLFTVTKSTSIVNVSESGTKNSIIGYDIFDKDGNSVKSNYVINYEEGELIVTERPITVTTKSDTKVYDGVSLANTDVAVADILENHVFKVISSAKIINVSESGTKNAVIEYDILDAGGRSVKGNYLVTYVEGELTVTKRPITVTTSDATGVYNGEIFHNSDVTVSDLVENHTFKVIESTGIVNVSESGTKNTILEYDIFDGAGNSVKDNYSPTYVEGELTVTARPITVITATTSKVYDGTALTAPDWIVSDESEYPLADGHRIVFDETKFTGTQTIVGTSDNASDGKVQIFFGETDVTSNYDITHEIGTLTVEPRPVILVTASDSKVYDGTPLVAYDWIVSDESEYPLADGHRIVFDTAKFLGTQTDADTSSNLYDGDVRIYCGEDDVTSNYTVTENDGTLTVEPRPITVITKTDTKVYDAITLFAHDWLVSDESEYPLVDGHTIYFEMANFTGAQTVVGTSYNTYDGEISILSPVGDVTLNYTITYKNGTLTVTPKTVYIATASDSKTYDGAPLSNAALLESSGLVSDHYFAVFESTAITDYGEADNEVISYDIFDGAGNSVKDNYIYEYAQKGKLTVNKRKITLTTDTASKVYDGTALTAPLWIVHDSSENQPVLGHTITFEASRFTGTQTNKGDSSNTYDGDVFIYCGSADVSGNYDIETKYGTLTVTARPVTLTTADAEKTYDAKPLTKPEWNNDNLVTGHTVSGVLPNGSITNAGTADNTYPTDVAEKLKILCGEEDVTENYDISYAMGTLTVHKREISVSTGSVSEMYDGKTHTAKFWVSENLVDGHSISAALPHGSQINAGTSYNFYNGEVKIYSSSEGDVTPNYQFEVELGTIEVTRRPVTLITGSGEKVYDGTPLTVHSWSLSSESPNRLVGGHEIRFDESCFTGSRTEMGESPNTYYIGNSEEVQNLWIYSGSENVTENYKITATYGVLTVTGGIIYITTDSGSKVYDGKPLVVDTFKVEGIKAAGHRFVVIESTEITNVSESGAKNVFTKYDVLDEDDNSVMKNYTIAFTEGTLIIMQREIKVVTADYTGVYDGRDHSYDKELMPTVDTSDGGKTLADGHSFKITSATPMKNVVTNKANVIEFVIVDESGNEVYTEAGSDANYKIRSVKNGKINISKYKLQIKTDSKEFKYDGTEHKYESFTPVDLVGQVTFDKLVYNDILYKNSTKITNVETKDNVFELVIYDDENSDVTSQNYDIEIIEKGKLTVTPRYIKVVSGSATKLDDGEELICHEVELDKSSTDKLVSGHNLVGEFTGKQIGPGSSDNTFTVKVKNGTADVTMNYVIEYVEGTLTIKEKTLSSGSSLGLAEDYDVEAAKNKIVFMISDAPDGKIYLKMASYGDYTGNGFGPAKEYSLLYGEYSASYILPLLLPSEAGYEITIDPKDGKYALPYYTLGGGQVSDVYVSGDATSPYSLVYIPGDYYGGISVSAIAGLEEFEALYREYVYDNYLAIDEETDEYLQKIIKEKGFSKDDSDIVNKIAKYIKRSASYSIDYDRALDEQSNVVIAFLGGKYEGVCQHYAASATMMFRALGIPARYTVGYAADSVYGFTTGVTEFNAHAWVEIYLDGIGWTKVEVTGSPKESITVKPTDITKTIDELQNGITVKAENKIEENDPVLRRLLADGYTYKVIVSGELNKIGSSQSKIETFVLYDEEGNDVTHLYNITKKNGTLKISGGTIKIYLYQITSEYDAKMHSCKLEDYYVVSNLPENMEFKINSINISLDVVGRIWASTINSNISEYIPSYSVYIDGDTTHDYKDSYTVQVVDFKDEKSDYTVVEITQRLISLKTDSASKKYDGTPLTKHSCSVVSGKLMEGHRIEAEYTGSQTEIGTSDNYINMESIKIFDADGNDVTEYYKVDENIIVGIGTLTVY